MNTNKIADEAREAAEAAAATYAGTDTVRAHLLAEARRIAAIEGQRIDAAEDRRADAADYVAAAEAVQLLPLISSGFVMSDGRPVVPAWRWRVALHTRDTWEGEHDVDPDLVDIGTMVRLVVGPHTAQQVKGLGGQSNAVKEGDLLPAMIVRRWSDQMVNLRVFIDGQRDLWLTSVAYSRPALQVGGEEGEMVADEYVLHANPDTWCLMSEPDELLPDSTMTPDGVPVEEGKFWRQKAIESEALIEALVNSGRIHMVSRYDDHPESGYVVWIDTENNGRVRIDNIGFDSDVAKALGLAPRWETTKQAYLRPPE